MRDGRVLAVVSVADYKVEVLNARTNVAIGLCIWLADASLHPDRYRPSTVETIHSLLAFHAAQVEQLRQEFGLEQLPPDAGEPDGEEDDPSEDADK